MSAVDNFRQFNASLPKELPQLLTDLIRQTHEELLAARSEDARNRIVETYLREVQSRARQ